ncbi:MAG: hypothetical protein Q9177_003016, partial [Variospora cf. flavescens]
KLDLWNVYVDAEVKKTAEEEKEEKNNNNNKINMERVRGLFLRVSRGKKWKAKQMKFWFKKWMQWEEGVGEEGGGGEKEKVETLAAEWMRRKAEEQGKGFVEE